MGFLKGLRTFIAPITGAKKAIDKISGKDRLRKQYNESCQAVDRLQAESLAKLTTECSEEHAKIASERHKSQLSLQTETERYLQEKSLLSKLMDEKEEHLKQLQDELLSNLELVKASLYACMNGQADIVEMLLKKDSNLRLGFFELLPLHIAAENNHTEIIKLLCRYGVNLNRQNDQGAAIDVAECLGHRESVLLLKSIIKQSINLRKAVKSGDILSIENALKNGADINSINSVGYNALQLAILHQQPFEIVRLLVEKGADLQYGDEEAPYLLAKNHSDARVGAYLIELSRKAQGIFNEKNEEALLNGPKWIDENNWHHHSYYSTIQSKLLVGKNYAYFISLGRNGTGLILSVYDFNKQQKQVVQGPGWGDGSWGTAPCYYTTIQLQAFDNQGSPQVLMIGRGGHGVEFCLYDIQTESFIELPKGPGWTDKDWGQDPRYYATIQTESYQHNGNPYILIMGRGGQGIDLYLLDINGKDCRHLGAGPQWTDKDWGQHHHHYSTIQMQVFLHFGTPKAFLLGRCGEGIDLYLYDIATQTLSQLPFGPKWSDGLHWFHPQYYRTIQARVALRQDGRLQLILIGRNGEGVCLSIFDLNTYTWHHFKGPVWSDARLWFLPDCYSTIQLGYLPGIEDDWIVISAKGPQGFETQVFSLKTELWKELPSVFLEGIDWSSVSHFSTLQFHCARINHEHKLLISARTPSGLKCWSYLINITELEHSLKTKRWVATNHNTLRVKAFLEQMNTLSQNLLEASVQGDILTLKSCLKQGADINAIDKEGFNALQKVILSQKANIELVSNLIRAGIDVDYQTPRGETALSLAKHQPIARLLRFEPILGIQKSLKALDVQSVYQAHRKKTLRFLNQYQNDFKKNRAIEAFYHYIAEVEPYALYAKPAFWLLSELRKTIETQQKGFIVSLKPLQRAQDLFIKMRAMHCTLIELGLNKAPFMEDYDWRMVENSVYLKTMKLEESFKDDKAKQDTLQREGIESFLNAFFVEVLGGHLKNWKELTPYFMNLPKISKPSSNTVIQQAVKSGVIQVPPKRHLRVGLYAWEKSFQTTTLEIEKQTKALQEERKALEDWLIQREGEYLAFKQQMETFIQTTYAADREVSQQFQQACQNIQAQFNTLRDELAQNFHEAKKKIDKMLCKNAAVIIATAAINPAITSALTSSFTALQSIACVVEGATAGVLMAGISGNTRNILKDMVIGGWMGGFGSVASNLLQNTNAFSQITAQLFKSSQLQATAAIHLRAALIAGAQTVIRTSIEGGKLTPSVLSNMGVTLALGPKMTQENLSLLEKMKEHTFRMGVSSVIVSGITKQNFLETVGAIGIGDFAYLLGSHIHQQLFTDASGSNLVYKKENSMKFSNFAHESHGFYNSIETEEANSRQSVLTNKSKASTKPPRADKGNTQILSVASNEPVQAEKPMRSVGTKSNASKHKEPLLIAALNTLIPEACALPYEREEGQELSIQDKRNIDDFLKLKNFYNPSNIKHDKDSKMLLFSSQAPRAQTALERRDELYKSIHGQYGLLHSSEATIVLGGVSGLVKGTLYFGMTVIRAAHDGILAITPGIQNTQVAAINRTYQRAEIVADFISHMPQRVSEGLSADFRRAAYQYEQGNYFNVGESASSFALIASPATLSSVYQLGNVGSKATRVAVKAGLKGVGATAKGIREFISAHDFISPITFQYSNPISNEFRLNHFPIDVIKPQKPWVKKKGVLEKQITEAGLYHPEPLLSYELSKIQEIQNMRNQYLKWERELDAAKLPSKSQKLLIDTKADHAIRDKIKPDDIAAIFKEGRGVKIYDKETGKLLNHFRKADEAQNALRNVIIELKDRLKELQVSGQNVSFETQLIQEKLSHLSIFKDLHADLIRKSKCQTEPNKLRL